MQQNRTHEVTRRAVPEGQRKVNVVPAVGRPAPSPVPPHAGPGFTLLS